MTSSKPTTSSPPALYCRHCGYNLQGQPATAPRCPECGRPFDPANPRTFRRRPLRRWLRHVKRAAYAALALVLILILGLAGTWGWLYWGWYDEQQVLRSVSAKDTSRRPLSPWLREHTGRAGFVLDRVILVSIDAGPAPVDLTPLASLKRLEHLHCGGSGIADLRPLARCTGLKDLYLWETGVTDLAPLSSLTNMESLVLIDCRVNDLSPLAALSKLDWFALHATAVTDLRPLLGLKGLRHVVVDETFSDAQIEALRHALPLGMVRRSRPSDF